MASKPPGNNVVPVRAQVKLPAAIAQSLQQEVAGIQARIGAPSGNRIKVTQKKTFRLPNGEETAGPISLVILDFITVHKFYPGAFDPDDIMPPDCFAIGREVATLAPHADVPAERKQGEACATCPQNQYGSAQRGKGKACQNTRLLAVLQPDATPDTPIATLSVSPTALRNFDGYVASIARSFNMPPVAVVTEVGFEPSLDYPSLRFSNPQPVTPEFLELALARREEATQILMTPPDTTSLKVEAVAKPKGGQRRARAA